MNKLDSKGLKIFKRAWYPKFIATMDEFGTPNVVPVLTTKAADESTLIFARFMIWKTAHNLETTRKTVVACMGPGLSVWRVRGEFLEFVKHGPYVEEFNETFLFRYNAYAGAEQVAVIKITDVLPPVSVQWVKTVAMANAASKSAASAAALNGIGPMPPQVVDKFNATAALKYIAHVGEDGWPSPRPALAMKASGRKALHYFDPTGEKMNPGSKMAASVITRDLIAYQVKGTFAGNSETSPKNIGVLRVEEAFTASPPLPGKKIEK